MIRRQDIRQIGPVTWEISTHFRDEMRVPVRIFADQALLDAALSDRSIEQAVNAATLPGCMGYVAVMPDVHQGYGFPIGGVAATESPSGVISPGGIGYDINCGVRLLSSRIPREAISGLEDLLAAALYSNCPSGVGAKGTVRLRAKDLDSICRSGAGWAVKNGFGRPEDVTRTEEEGALSGAEPSAASQRERERGRLQLGSLGAGNHFIEVGVVEEIYHREAARAMGLTEGHITLQIHCGSRGFGHQICSDSVRELQLAVRRYAIQLPDRELVCAPLDSPEGRRYFAAMACAANYAFSNRQVLTHLARRAFEQVLAGEVSDWDLRMVYDITHNIGKLESHQINGEHRKVCVHRKGATRAFGPGFAGLPPEYRQVGQPVLVPGSMGTASWVLVGEQAAMDQSLGSCCHGAGRVMSRSKAKKTVRGRELLQELRRAGIAIQAGSMPGLAEEAPAAYKDVDAVVEVVSRAGIARKVARLRPVIVIKG